MENNAAPAKDLIGQQFPSKPRQWPWVVGITILIFCHGTFFLPFRVFVPVSPNMDPWWGFGLILVDGVAGALLLRLTIRRVMRIKTHATGE